MRAALFIVAAIVCAAPVHAAGFLTAIEDIPLMDGFTETAEPVVFESGFGRVVQTRITGQASGHAIARFYGEALPALGWAREGGDGLAFVRETERLTIAIREPASSRPVEVTFELVVKLASSDLPE